MEVRKDNINPQAGVWGSAPFGRRFARRGYLAAGRARRGSVLILVMAILGILFVTGITFLSTMNYEARMVSLEREAERGRASVSDIRDLVVARLVDNFVAGPGRTAAAGTLGEVTNGSFRSTLPARVELPGVHGVIGQLEPDPTDQLLRYFGVTNLETMHSGQFDAGSVVRGNVSTQTMIWFRKDIWDSMSVDSDGDGMIDTRQYRLFPSQISGVQFSQLSTTVNDPANPDGRVYLGLRIVPHGAMVNLNDSHPLLLRAALHVIDDSAHEALAIANTNRSLVRHGPYSPSLEEGSLRRRGSLPPRIVPASAIQGDPNDSAQIPPGGGDFGFRLFHRGNNLFDNGEETVLTGKHQYWPYLFDVQSQLNQYDLWTQRMDPATSDSDTGGIYDHRHLVTTISHDDQLILEPTVEFVDPSGPAPKRRVDNVMEIMRAVARFDLRTQGGCELAPPRFEYLNYPYSASGRIHDANTANDGGVQSDEYDDALHSFGAPLSWCECEANGYSQDERKGRLRLSLPFLDSAVPIGMDKSLDRPIDVNQRNQLIQEAFWLLLMNARSEEAAGEWGAYTGFTNDFDAAAVNGGNLNVADAFYFDQAVDADNSAPNPAAALFHGDGFQSISRTAAALTANMIDFMDGDDDPTAIPVRWYGITEQGWRALNNPNFEINLQNQDFQRWLGQFGGVLDQDGFIGADEVVYGLERQPFITEVGAKVLEDPDAAGAIDFVNSAFAVELFNPYDDGALPTGGTRLFLRVGIGGQDIEIIGSSIPSRGFLVVFTDPGDNVNGTSLGLENVNKVSVGTLGFDNGDTVYLLRDVPFGGGQTRVVLDQFQVRGDSIAVPRLDDDPDNNPITMWTVERPSVQKQPSNFFAQGPWFASLPIPDDFLNIGAESNTGTLGNDNASIMADDYPVEVLFANTGKFATAFPTTGSLLLLMRHANRAINSAAPGGRYAFTSHLRQTRNVVGVAVESSQQIDNGRMPVFDIGNLHHVDPMGDPHASMRDPPIEDVPNEPHLWIRKDWEQYRPGEFSQLPWGQLVFEYFTALPLSSDGPYRNKDSDSVDETAQPRVDLDGLRVHGRINLNAAPWSVMKGLPLVPMGQIPGAFRETFRAQLENTLGLGVGAINDNLATPIGPRLAKAIAAYRDAREFKDAKLQLVTGNYDDEKDPIDPNNPRVGRGWELQQDLNNPNEKVVAFRRGTGFLTVGELANVRHEYTKQAGYRIDSQQISRKSLTGTEMNVGVNSYLKAIAVLASLGDWTTVRSHVFTVYGTLRGEPGVVGQSADVALTDINTRAIRFQETIDRLPVFLGDARPVRIGDGVVGRYNDAVND